ncbi:MAG: SUMF1/EgtB/PvdO family nonheme iron enzyme [Pyrinomonadaceae bacterium]
MRECQLCKHCFTDDVAACPNDGMPTAHTINGEPVLEGKYHLELRLGQGGMGVVYKARHAYLKTYHAIKIILPDLVGNDPQLVTRFRQEALAAAAIRHQNVVAVTDYGVIQGSIPFLVMEYVEGESLHDLLAREKRLSPEMAFELISAVCAGVGAAHHQGIVHRDLKPLNIMICKDKPSISQAVKILDFGLAKIKSGELLGSFIQAQTTGLMGSPYYMAPEQWSDDDPDARSDIYSLGVMLFQMMTGDVPFKGSSIPAIMKKHISDPPPTFAEVGLTVTPEIEQAVRHTLQKDPDNRTPTVEAMVDELRAAIYPAGIGIQTAGGGHSLPVSSLNIRTQPPGSNVYVDNVPVGQTREDGWITLNGIQSGNHLVRVSHDGFEDWLGDVVCDGRPQMVQAELRARGEGGAAPADVGQRSIGGSRSIGTTSGFSRTTPEIEEGDQTILQNVNTGPGIFSDAERPARSTFFSPLVIAMLVVVGLVGLAGAGLAGAYLLGVFGPSRPADTQTNANARPTASPSPASSTGPATRAEMVLIPGGTFKMGRNDGRENERPEHEVTVKPFMMDKTEVTNAEYFEFVNATGRRPTPAHWVNDKPIPGQEQMPVRFVSYDDAMAFAEWRSQRDGVAYRLPTEEEWEFAARNGAKADLYPWGDKYDAKCAVLDEPSHEPKAVGSRSCPNQWGVVDLIGNVFEWTSSPPSLYPGSPGTLKPLSESYYMVRGGSALYKSTGPLAITATFRQEVPAKRTLAELGFRLVRSP